MTQMKSGRMHSADAQHNARHLRKFKADSYLSNLDFFILLYMLCIWTYIVLSCISGKQHEKLMFKSLKEKNMEVVFLLSRWDQKKIMYYFSFRKDLFTWYYSELLKHKVTNISLIKYLVLMVRQRNSITNPGWEPC